VELTHSFTVPVDRATALAAFEDLSSVAECFPGAVVTSVEGDTFQGTCKVKLGPVALQYAGSGTFVERDEAAGRLVLDAKGRDKRGNGTAGAHVTATFEEVSPSSTRVQVVTDLQITGKPAQFGRGVIQDVSDKLLGQFVDCLEAKVAGPAGEPAPAADAGTSAPTAVAETTPPAAPAAPAAPRQEALDLGATVLPVLLKSYGKQVVITLLVVLVLVRLVRSRHRR
jgi:carbon monoxide dehydrogenase subunit G